MNKKNKSREILLAVGLIGLLGYPVVTLNRRLLADTGLADRTVAAAQSSSSLTQATENQVSITFFSKKVGDVDDAERIQRAVDYCSDGVHVYTNAAVTVSNSTSCNCFRISLLNTNCKTPNSRRIPHSSAVPYYPLTFNVSASTDCAHAEQFDVASQMIRRNGLFVHQIGGEVFLVVVGKDGRDNGILVA